MKRFLQSSVLSILAVALVPGLAGCRGSAVKRDLEKLRKKCDFVPGGPVSEGQARCIAGIHGVRDSRGCPMEVDRPDGYGEPVYRVRESCNGLGVVVAESTGRVLAVVAGDETVYR